jgi:hypothetical protein
MLPSDPEQRTQAVPPTGLRQRTVLVVDDDAACCRVMAEMLRNAGYDTIEAYDFAVALDALEDPARAVDLLLTDVRMPVHGFALARMARRRRPLLRVLYITGYPELAAEEPPEAGSKLLVKPILSDKLVAEVGASFAVA